MQRWKRTPLRWRRLRWPSRGAHPTSPQQSHACAQARDHDAQAGLGGDFTWQVRFIAAAVDSRGSRQTAYALPRPSRLRASPTFGGGKRSRRHRAADDGMRCGRSGQARSKDRCQRRRAGRARRGVDLSSWPGPQESIALSAAVVSIERAPGPPQHPPRRKRRPQEPAAAVMTARRRAAGHSPNANRTSRLRIINPWSRFPRVRRWL